MNLLPKPARRAFSLIESAIVLGVVGLVIGGVWLAAASVQEKKKWADFEEGMLFYIQLIDQNFGPQSYQGSSDPLEPWFEMQPLPRGWTGKRSDPASAQTYHPYDPYGNALYGMIMVWGSTPVYSVGYPWATISRELCAKISMLMFTRVNKSYPIHTYTLPNPACSPADGWNYGDFYDNCCPTAGSVNFFMKL